MRIYIIGNYSTIFLKKELEKKLINNNIKSQIINSNYDSIDFNILDENSELYNFNPDILIWHESTLKIREYFWNYTNDEKVNFALNYEKRICNYSLRISTKLPNCRIIFINHSLLFNDNLFGNYALKVENSWQFQVIKTNYLLNNLAIKSNNLFLIDSSLPMYRSSLNVTDYALYITADLNFTLEYLELIATSIVSVISSLIGKSKKCIILDLDNTIWGGVIGDDGLDGIEIGNYGIGKAFSKFQTWLKELSRRGIILTVCSKNTDVIAKEPFLSHPEMILKLEDIALFVANWKNKADNIRYIQRQLNISFDSMVFIDDNPAERDIVTCNLPEVLVPDLPGDPCDYLPYLISLNIFETTTYSSNDQLRTKQYIDQIKRQEDLTNHTNMDQFLDSLSMKIIIQSFKENNFERISQLTLRSNQFNLTTKRYNVSDILQISKSPKYLTYSVTLSDKFGDNGLISIVILQIFENIVEIDTWLMSCRVLNRGVENFLMNHIVTDLISKGYSELKGFFIPTEKNSIIKNLLIDLGMTLADSNKNLYNLQLKTFNKFKTHINYDNNN
jgi:FkbH-like protein